MIERFIAVVLAATAAPAFAVPACDPADHGGVPDDNRIDTEAIQAAIDACGGTGGRVTLGAGTWLTGTLVLRPDMEFHLAGGAVLTLAPDIDLFPEQCVRRADGSDYTFRAGLYAPAARNLILSGPGRIEGNGERFWDTNFYDLGIPRPTLPRPGPVIELSDCANVTVRDITMTNLPAYALRFHRCDGARAENVTIRNDPRSPNTDGIQIRDSSGIRIIGADIATGDDAIVLKSRDRAVENIIVNNSLLESDDSAIKFGTGSHIGVRHSLFSDIVIRNSRYGIAIFQVDGGAHLDNRFHNISIETGGRHERTYPIFIDIDRREADRGWGRIERLTFSNIEIVTSGASLIAGNARAPIRDLTLRDIRMSLPEKTVDLALSSGKPRGSVTIEDQAGSEDYARIPAHFTIANVDGLILEGIQIDAAEASPARDGAALIETRFAAPPELRLEAGGQPVAKPVRQRRSARQR